MRRFQATVIYPLSNMGLAIMTSIAVMLTIANITGHLACARHGVHYFACIISFNSHKALGANYYCPHLHIRKLVFRKVVNWLRSHRYYIIGLHFLA